MEEDIENFDYENIEYVKVQLYRSSVGRVCTPYDTGNNKRLHGFNFFPISTREFDSALNTFKHKAPGSSEITTLLLKNLPQNMKRYLLYVFNNAVSAVCFADTVKHALKIFIPKSGSHHLVISY